MTIIYHERSFIRCLFRWRGSLYQAVWKELLVFLIVYFIINFSYRLGMNYYQQETFETIVGMCEQWANQMPIQFLLGFYVTYIIGRWWEQWKSIAWPDRFMLSLSVYLPGQDESSRILRRSIARHLNLYMILVWKELSLKVKKRFPSDVHLVKAGLITTDEYTAFRSVTGTYGRSIVPVSWIATSLSKCHSQGKITDFGLAQLMSELHTVRGCMAQLAGTDYMDAPLIYTQLATLVTYGYFVLCLLGRQILSWDNSDDFTTDSTQYRIDMYIPFFTCLEFLFYMGWLKVAEQYRTPFGEDDNDFDSNYFVDRNMQVSLMLADELASQNVKPTKDSFWGRRRVNIPHTKASMEINDDIPNSRYESYSIPHDEVKVSKN